MERVLGQNKLHLQQGHWEHTISATFKKVEETVEDVPVIELPFKDVHEDNWFYNSVKYAYEKGLMQGTGLTLSVHSRIPAGP